MGDRHVSGLERTVHSGRWAITDGRSRVYLDRYDPAQEGFEPTELEVFRTELATPTFYALLYSEIDLCGRAVTAIANDSRLVVDNEHGLVLAGPELVAALAARPFGDWRNEDSREAVPGS